MATLAFAAAGAAVGGSIFPAGVSLFGATLSGATLGGQIGALAGSVVDQALFGASGPARVSQGPRLSDLRVTASSEGAAIPRLYGRARLGGQVIWAANIEETVTTETAGGGGKGGAVAANGQATTQVSYSYFASFAVAICEGTIRGVNRIWADGEELDISSLNYRLYTGTQNQAADALIAADLGTDRAPAFRGTAYIVFERLALAPFGNRLPQLSFEVMRAVDELSSDVRAVVLIPGTGEFSLSTTPVFRNDPSGTRQAENVHTKLAGTDIQAALDQLDAALPNVKNVSLVTSWFGTDLRAGNCQIRPGVDQSVKSLNGRTWSVAGQSRAGAHVISTVDGRPAYGGTPTDDGVVETIKLLKSRGKAVTLTPFILMDIPAETELPNPYEPGSTQPRYPWRGRITVDPAPSVAGSVDQTSAAATQLQNLVGTAQRADFAVVGATVIYSGPSEWSFRRFVLHHAYLAKAAGGVDTFVIGTELRGLTQVRDTPSRYPFVLALRDLADDVRAVLGAGTKITYAADWSEFFGHQPADGSGDVFFHLDPLWASDNIDAVGIDLYWPLSDWRDGTAHRDATAARSVYDLAYLKSNIAGGEYFDWYYASDADRLAQRRTPISDQSVGKPWVFRAKDLTGWWLNQHFDRPGGIERTSPTDWVAQSKPIWFMEYGCPALDNGANQPNVFYDPKSSESFLPYFSRGIRDDTMQRRYIQALVEAYDPHHSGAVAGLNPVSSVYGARMVDPERMYVYAWDGRPFPAFPFDTATWSDGDNWQFGHWLNGRMAGMPLDAVVRQILRDAGFDAIGEIALDGIVPGFLIDGIMSARDALQPLELTYFFDAIETGGTIAFRHRGQATTGLTFTRNDLVETRAEEPLVTLTRGQETDLPETVKLTYVSASGDYRSQVAEARRRTGYSRRLAKADVPIMLESAQAERMAESWLYETWSARERAQFRLPPSQLAVEPGDVVSLAIDNSLSDLRIVDVSDGGAREIEARALDPSVYAAASAANRPVAAATDVTIGAPDAAFLDLPLLRGDEPDTVGYAAFAQTPWPGAVTLDRSANGAGYSFVDAANVPARLGVTLSVLVTGPVARIDRANTLDVALTSGDLVSVDRATLLSGANVAAVEVANGIWEVLQFETADLIGPRQYRLSGLLRGQAGSDADMTAAVAAGARFCVIDTRVLALNLNASDIARPFHWRYGPTGRDVFGTDFATTVHAFRGLGRRPLAPVHVRATRASDGISMSWIRRTRRGGDSWEQVDVPLAETSEAYDIDILSGESVVRTLSANAPAVTYRTQDMNVDFAQPPTVLRGSVYQRSETWGRGAAADFEIAL